MRSGGGRVHPAPASASDAPMSFMKSRRPCDVATCAFVGALSPRASAMLRQKRSCAASRASSGRGSETFGAIFGAMWLAMTGGAVGELAGRAQAIELREPGAARVLIGRRSPLDVEDRLSRAQIALGRSMAIEAPLHVQRRNTAGERHAPHVPVARAAAHAL